MKYRIVNITDGFDNKYYVQSRFKLLWIFPIWLYERNPNGTDYWITRPWAEEYISKKLHPIDRNIINYN